MLTAMDKLPTADAKVLLLFRYSYYTVHYILNYFENASSRRHPERTFVVRSDA
jgi:hypothetical protein